MLFAACGLLETGVGLVGGPQDLAKLHHVFRDVTLLFPPPTVLSQVVLAAVTQLPSLCSMCSFIALKIT